MLSKERITKPWVIASAAALFGICALKGMAQDSSRARRSRRLQAEVFQGSRLDVSTVDDHAELIGEHADIPRRIGNLFIPAPAFVESVRQNPRETVAVLRTIFNQVPESDI